MIKDGKRHGGPLSQLPQRDGPAPWCHAQDMEFGSLRIASMKDSGRLGGPGGLGDVDG